MSMVGPAWQLGGAHVSVLHVRFGGAHVSCMWSVLHVKLLVGPICHREM